MQQNIQSNDLESRKRKHYGHLGLDLGYTTGSFDQWKKENIEGPDIGAGQPEIWQSPDGLHLEGSIRAVEEDVEN